MAEQIYEKDDSNEVIFQKPIVKNESIPERKISDSSSIKSELIDSNEKEKIKEELREQVVEAKNSERVPTGVKGFDDLIEGGFEKNSIVLVAGSAGTGKTLFSMQFLYSGVTKFNEAGIFISFEEEEDSLYSHAKQFGWNFKELENDGKFKLLFFKPHQVTKIIEEGGGQIRDAITEIGAKRVVIDSITAYGLLFRDEYNRREKILEFFTLLSKWGITALIIAEDNPTDLENEEGSIAFISDAVISMFYHHDEEKGIRTHSLEILKMRGTKHTNKVCALDFEEDGLRVYPDVEVF